MAKTEWGKKRVCPACNIKYYDFNKSPITCPSCGIEFDPDIYLRSKKGKSLSTKVISENNKDVSKISEEVVDIDDIEINSEEEVENDEDSLHELNKEDHDDSEVGINIDGDISFIDEDEINEDDGVGVDIIDEKKS